MNSNICPISGETAQEERLNHTTHLFGLLLALIGLPLLVVHSSLAGNFWNIVSFTIYGITLVLLYGVSTFYHWSKKLHHKRTLQIVDHSCIYLLIAGSYTPFTLGPLIDSHGWLLFGIEWGIATIGILFKIFAFNKFQVSSLIAYLVMGWLVILSGPSLLQGLSTSSIILLAVGGLSYTVGIVFFLWDNLPFNHSIWHLFVLTASSCHFFAIYFII